MLGRLLENSSVEICIRSKSISTFLSTRVNVNSFIVCTKRTTAYTNQITYQHDKARPDGARFTL